MAQILKLSSQLSYVSLSLFLALSLSSLIAYTYVRAQNSLSCFWCISHRDNADGGDNGPETVSLTNPTASSQFTYLLAANDFDFSNNGNDFLISCTTFNIQNNIQSYDFQKLSASAINITHQHYFFGCLTFQSSKFYFILKFVFTVKVILLYRWGVYSYWCSIRNFL